MELSAVFETWHIGDGNYPPLNVGEPVNLSFEIEPEQIALAGLETNPELRHLGQARYQFSGRVLRVYREGSGHPIVVIEAGSFRFYVHSPKAAAFSSGDRISGLGTLLFDHYIWVEFLSRYLNPPDLFYTLRVTKISRYRLPERFISRSSTGGVAYPTRVDLADYALDDISEVNSTGDEDFVSYVLDFSDENLPSQPTPRTFMS